MLVRALLLISLLISLNQAFAIERRYLAPMEESLWKMTTATAVYCEMEHVIPRFGKAIFYQSAGRDLKLRLVTHQRFKSGLHVNFQSQAPHWKSEFSSLQLASLSTRESNTLLEVGTRTARHAYLELHAGFHPGFYFSPDKDLIDPTVVMMSTVRFRSVEPEFEQCVSNLHHDNYEDVRVSKIHFEHDEEFPILQEEETAFKSMLDYLQVDASIREVVVSGHADKTGAICYNDTLSSRRAWYVYDLLLAKGIDPKIITLDYYGEHRPLLKGESDAALSANRRVTVELLK